MLGLEVSDSSTVVPCKSDWQTRRDVSEIFNTLLELDDEQIAQILTFVIAETLPCGSGLVDKLGEVMAVDMRESWQPDTAFFDLLRDKQAINAMLAEVSDKASADAHIASTAKVQKQAIQDALNDAEQHTSNWLPRYMTFPCRTYRGEQGDQN